MMILIILKWFDFSKFNFGKQYHLSISFKCLWGHGWYYDIKVFANHILFNQTIDPLNLNSENEEQL